MIIPPPPYGISPERFKRLPPKDFPDSIAWSARYWRMESGIESQSSPVSMLFFARSFILARLGMLASAWYVYAQSRGPSPVREPYLHGSFRHIDVLRNPLPHRGRRCWVL